MLLSAAAGRDVLDFALSPDSSRVVFQRVNPTGTAVELYSAPGTGGAAIQLNGAAAAADGDATGLFLITPDSSRVLYLASQPGSSTVGNQLFSSPPPAAVAPSG